MTAVVLGLALVLVVLVVATLWRTASRRAALAAERRQRPPALRDAELVFVEQTFRSQGRWPIVARVDRVYRLPSGELLLVELKTRSRPTVTMSDVIQLSAQRVAMVDSLGDVVADVAFVMVSAGHGKTSPIARMVRLLSPAQVEAIAVRRQLLIDGAEPPEGPSSEQVCRGCAHRVACRAAGGDRTAPRTWK